MAGQWLGGPGWFGSGVLSLEELHALDITGHYEMCGWVIQEDRTLLSMFHTAQ